ncbi:MAG: HD domain-containing protein, partial [Alistipes sp.]|nr:HD domain-containing protein [Alistipes sp.]
MDFSRYEQFRATVRSNFSVQTQQAVDEALAWASERLDGEVRYNGAPMLDHAVGVASIVISEVGLGRNSAVASILHDVVRLAHKRLPAEE